MKLSISFIVPFYNEEELINLTYKNIKKIINFFKIKNYEILFVNDCSKDSSEKFVLKIKKKNKKVLYYKHKKNYGLGAALKTGILKSKKNYVIWVPGDNEHDFRGLKPLFLELKKKEHDIIIPYVINTNSRNLVRRLISKVYTIFLNIIFFKNIPYYNGCSIYKKNILKFSIKNMQNPSMTFISEMLLRSMRLTKNYKIVGYNLKISKKIKRKSSALKLNNILIGIYYIMKLRLSFVFI